MKRFNLSALVFAVVSVLSTSAMAHAFLDNAVPKVGSVVSMVPKEITIQYTQPVEAAFSHIKLVKSDGQMVEVGAATTDPSDQTKLSVLITGKLTPGEYEVQWDVVSVDTHTTNGHFPFTYQP